MRVNERALLIVVAALGCYNERPYDKSCPKDEKDEITFSHWALDEILNLVWDHPWMLASEVIEDFELKCQLFAASCVSSDQEKVFTIAAQTASKILEDIKEVEKFA